MNQVQHETDENCEDVFIKQEIKENIKSTFWDYVASGNIRKVCQRHGIVSFTHSKGVETFQ